MRRASGILCIILLAALVGCDSTAPPGNLPTVQMKLGQKVFTLEIAADAGAREHGLMRRDSMPPDHGMIFVFEHPQPMTFWMKDTRIPLDVLFIDEDGKIIAIKQMKPYDEVTRTTSDGDALWAIELNKGAADAAGAHVGEVVTIPPAARSTR